LLVIFINIEPVQFGVIFPFVYFMVQGFQIESDPKQLGKYVGILTSTFCFAQLLSSLPWGWISNRIGRKTVVIIGLIGNAITCSLFGLSKTFAFAMLTRFFCGLLNGNLGVIKSMLGEMTDDSNRSIAFSYWEAAAGLGQIFGPVLGGILVNPATRFPDYFGDCQFLRENPYFLPCFVSSLFSISGAVLGYFFMKERTSKEHDAEREPLLTSELDDIESSAQIEVQRSVAKILNRKVCAAIAMYGMWCLVTIIFEEIYTILVAEPIGKGGLAFNSYDIGLNLSMTGLVQVIVQLCVFPSLQRSLGLPNVYRLAAITMVIFSVGLSYCPGKLKLTRYFFLDNKWWRIFNRRKKPNVLYRIGNSIRKNIFFSTRIYSSYYFCE
jgi:MFS family permease